MMKLMKKLCKPKENEMIGRMRNAIKAALGNNPIQMEINQGIITVKDQKGEFLFSLKGKVRVEETLRDCERFNSEDRKKLDVLSADQKGIILRLNEINETLKTLCKD